MHEIVILRAGTRSMPSAALVLGLALSSLLTLGCSDDDVPPVPPAERFASLTVRAQEVRELSLLRDVPIDSLTRDEYGARVDAQVQAIDEQELQELADTYGRLGFFDETIDLRSTLSGSRDWVGASYSFEEERIILIGDVPDETVVHELVHSLQDQHFDLGAYDDTETSDAFLARRAVVEGDAELASSRFVLNATYGLDLDRLDWSKYFPTLVEHSRELLAKSTLPVFFAAYPSFVYTTGLIYCAHNLTGASLADPEPTQAFPYTWSREDALFSERPPASTLQVMTLDELGAGAVVGLDDVPPPLAERFERVDWDVLGAYYTYLLFYSALESAEVDGALGLGWRGDRALFVRDRDTSAVGVVWTSQWNGAEAAERAEAALRTIHGITADAVEPSLGTAANGEVVWIERTDTRVVFLKNVDAASAPELASASLSATEPRIAPPRARPPLDRRMRRDFGQALRTAGN